MSTENGHAGRPGKTRRQSCPQKSASRPVRRLVFPRARFQARRAEFFVAWDALSIARPRCPQPFDSPDTSGCALCACAAPPPPSAVPGMQPAPSAMFRLRSAHLPKSFPQPRLRRIRHRSPQNFLPSRAVSPDLRADSETFCRRGPACAPVPRPKALTPSQSVRVPSRRTNASAPRTKVHEKTRRKAPRKGDSSPRHASKGKNA